MNIPPFVSGLLQFILILTGILLIAGGTVIIIGSIPAPGKIIPSASAAPHTDSSYIKKLTNDTAGKKVTVTTETTIYRTMKLDDCSTCLVTQRDNMLKKGYDYILMGLILLFVVLTLPYVTSLNFLGVFSATFREKIEAGKAIINDAANAANVDPSKHTPATLGQMEITQQQKEGVKNITQSADLPVTAMHVYPDDTQKGKWGGSAENNSRKMTASLQPLGGGAVKVFLKVISTNIDKPIKDNVRFHLPSSFPNPDPLIYVIQGEAKLEFITLAAFTIGAETDNSATKLELNLADLPEAPLLFKSK
jgi:hypothetical protein